MGKRYAPPTTRVSGAEEVPRRHVVIGLVFVVLAIGAAAVPQAARFGSRTPLVSARTAQGVTYSESAIAMPSAACASGQNAEVEQAADLALGYVYADWMGCQGIAFARSRDGGRTWDDPLHVPMSLGSNVNAWDPAVAVGPDGTVYAAFMRAKNAQWYPFVAVSTDHGASFAYATGLVPPDFKNWGDRDFLAVAPNGTVYLTYDYGPLRSSLTYICAASGSCAFLTGDLNVVIQWSRDQGRTWSPIVPVSPGFPASGGDSAPFWFQPDGTIDVLYQGYRITNSTTYTMDPAQTYFTASRDGGVHWSAPVLVGPGTGTMSLSEWWIDGSLGIDAAGDLYAAWDTQGAQDIGWLSVSTDRGTTWSPAVQVTPPGDGLAAHIMEVAGGGAGVAYVTYEVNTSTGWALYLRVFSAAQGFLTAPILVSQGIYGALNVWPGDTTGISTLSPTQVVVTWGSAVPVGGQPKSQIFAAVLTFQGT